jgi:hypothetical protein
MGSVVDHRFAVPFGAGFALPAGAALAGHGVIDRIEQSAKGPAITDCCSQRAALRTLFAPPLGRMALTHYFTASILVLAVAHLHGRRRTGPSPCSWPSCSSPPSACSPRSGCAVTGGVGAHVIRTAEAHAAEVFAKTTKSARQRIH